LHYGRDIMLNFMTSLLLTIILSFHAPIVVVGVMLGCFLAVSYIPGLALIGQTGIAMIEDFLAVFGSGCPLKGILTIGFSCGLVGGLFDIYNYHCYQSLKNSLKSLGEES